jgi:RND superfamily putative drug exporter
LILVLLLGSVILPIKAVIMTVLSISASFGALVFVFQWGNLAEFFDFTPSGFVDATMPIIIFSVLFGLSMDYEIFLLSRIREEYAASGDNTEAVALGLARTGGIITSIAAIMVVIAASFTLAGIVSVKALGLGIALAVGLDATIVRGLLVPATMCLLGRWNWWAPASLTRWLNSGIRTGVH